MQHSWDTTNNIGPSEYTSGFRPLNLVTVVGLALYGICYFLPFFSLESIGFGGTITPSEHTPTTELMLTLTLLSFGVIAALTGFYPIISKVVITTLFIINGFQWYDLYIEGSNMMYALRSFGLGVDSSEGLKQALELVDIGLYLYLASILILTYSLFNKQKENSQNAVNSLKGFIGATNQQMRGVGNTLKLHDSSHSIQELSINFNLMKTTLKNKNFSQLLESTFTALKAIGAYLFGYLKAIFLVNNLGKVLVIMSFLLSYHFVF